MQIYTNLPNCNSDEKQISLLHSKNIVFTAIYPVGKSHKFHYQRKFLFQ